MRQVAVRVASRSCAGARAENEDRLAAEQCQGYWCLVLSDGAGGHQHGARAAQLVVERIVNGFRSRPPSDPRDLSELVMDAHDAIIADRRSGESSDGRSDMHATVVVLLIDTVAGVAYWSHVGDSRLYHWGGGSLHEVTRDDSALQVMLDTGLLAGADLHKFRNRSVLVAALGASEEAVPHVSKPCRLERPDAFLLCSDGWWNGLDPEIMSGLLQSADSPQGWLDAMTELTLARADPRQDNFSAIACWVD